jgi:hypothetical protein
MYSWAQLKTIGIYIKFVQALKRNIAFKNEHIIIISETEGTKSI